MHLFIETIRIENGEIQNLDYHQKRLNETFIQFWPQNVPIQLKDFVKPTTESGVFKARVIYGKNGLEEISYSRYAIRRIQSLNLVTSDSIEYSYKSTDREALNQLFEQRNACEDVLIIRKGLLTDTSIANIALFDGKDWYTPKEPLLKGTKRAQLLKAGVLIEKQLYKEDLDLFSQIRIFNAMINWGELELPVKNICSQ